MNTQFLGHPKGLFLVSGVELWERFSYYGMLGLLVLFLTANASTGGFYWSTPTALKLMGIYSGFVFAAPAVGGWIANRFWGERKCILYGGVLVVLGHLLLGGPAYFPAIIDWLAGSSVSKALLSDGISYETFFLSESALKLAGFSNENIDSNTSLLLLGYHLKLWSFLIGLCFIVMGTGLIKPAVSSIINHLYSPQSKSRQTGYAIFMASIYLGSFSANFIAGTLGEKVGWHVGFTAAAIGMIIGVVTYVHWQQSCFGEIGSKPLNPKTKDKTQQTKLTPEDINRLALVICMGIFTIVYAVAFYQKGGMLNLYTKEYVDRVIFGFEIPATWFLSISTGIFILFAPFLVNLFASQFPKVNAIKKLALGLMLIGLSYSLLALGDMTRENDSHISAIWILLTYFLFGLGDVLVWPSQISAAAALSPKHLTSFVVGAWYLTIGIGSWFTGYVGALSTSYSHLSVFVGISVVCLLSAGLLYLSHNRLLKLSSSVSI
ncbi:MAG: peptide MFS transporter [Paraglaciecola sp.]|uniref:peptide MFS transporter n=1 Tax=Paraglaciecola sp. TaxID=1920173 RepID=UPI0032981CBF